ncbi:hypothetical protein KO561_14540 [Radiobacillus kanasensis]|uniref:hypothetical protein n=1 Tax=Radiobacillus kanasensis TaxID=2844358 RepID=UPI001E4ACEE2|nr:hypothetical protein [Radiobacillus kanasensis]UFT98408.1 hypothetical protein KO561_14540 [Radiobacillus kanasensis]
MKINGEPTWSVTTQGVEQLNFAVYVACTYELIPDQKPFSSIHNWSSVNPSKSLTEKEMVVLTNYWLRWWELLVSERAKIGSHAEFYKPDYFDSLAPELGEICKELWQAFRKWWEMPAGGSMAMSFWESLDPVGKYVAEFEKEIGRKAKPFRLNVDLVYAGFEDVYEVTDDYVIMPLRSPNKNKTWWMKKIKSLG